jgi:exo-beta-1,3-glucanase (GH17 family)
MAFLPVFIIANATIPLVTYFGGEANSPQGWQLTMVVYSALAVVCFWMTFALTRERVKPEPKEKGSLGTDVKDLTNNRPWVVLCVVGIAALTYANIRGTVLVYYFDYVVPNGSSYFGAVLTTGAIGFIVGVMLTSPLAKRFGKRRFYMVSMSLAALLTIAYYFVPPDNIPLVWAGHGLISLLAAPTAPLVWAMYADTADYSEWKTGRRATGLVFSAASFAQKLGWAIGGGGAGWLLAYFGYVPNVAQDAYTVNGIMLMVSIIPAVFAIVAVVALWFYEIDEPVVERMAADLEKRRGPKSVPAEAPAVTPGAASLAPTSLNPLTGSAVLSEQVARWNQQVRASAADGRSVAPSAPPQAAWARQGAQTSGAAAELLLPHERARLADDFRAVLDAGVHGLCFSPYVDQQAPGSQVSEAQIRARLAVIRPYTRWIRSFSCTDGHEQTPRIAHELGMKTLVGAWLGTNREINEREIDGVIAVARAGHGDIVAVGNEVLLREDMPEDELLEYIHRVKQALPGVPVGYVDAYFLFEKHPRITAACDVVMTNCYPFWEGCPRDQAIPYMQQMYQRTKAAAAGKRVIISETGWPDKGSAFHGAFPSEAGAMRYFIDTQRWAQSEGVEVFYFAAFDEAWKVGAEGDVGAYWGLWDKDARPKFG